MTRFYDKAVWRQFRKRVLAERPWCELCERAPALHVDHKRSLRDGGAMLSMGNVQALCVACHGRKTALHDRAFGRAPRRGEAVPVPGCGVDGLPIDPNHHWRAGGHRDGWK